MTDEAVPQMRRAVRNPTAAPTVIAATKFLGGDRRKLLIQIGWQDPLLGAIDPIQRYAVAIANFRCHVDGYAPAALLKRIVRHLEKFFSPSRCESDSLTAMG